MLIRDRVGQKPLFYHKNEEQVLFSSNLLSVASLIKSPQISEQGFLSILIMELFRLLIQSLKILKKSHPAK